MLTNHHSSSNINSEGSCLFLLPIQILFVSTYIKLDSKWATLKPNQILLPS